MRIIGIDPGTICCGYGIVESKGKSQESGKKTERGLHNSQPRYIIAGDVQLNKKDPLPVRLKMLYESLCAIVDEYTPTHLSLEKIFYHKSIRSAFALGSTRGVVLLLAAQYSLPVFEYNPTEVKMALTGYGRAEKRQVQEMVKIILDLKSSALTFSEDSTDSLALCICHLHSSSFNNKI